MTREQALGMIEGVMQRYQLSSETSALSSIFILIAYNLLAMFLVYALIQFILWSSISLASVRFLIVGLLLLQIGSMLNKDTKCY